MSAVSYAKARQAKTDETAQPKAELVLVVVWFSPSKRDVLLSLVFTSRGCIINLWFPTLKPGGTHCRRVYESSYNFFASLFDLDS